MQRPVVYSFSFSILIMPVLSSSLALSFRISPAITQPHRAPANFSTPDTMDITEKLGQYKHLKLWTEYNECSYHIGIGTVLSQEKPEFIFIFILNSIYQEQKINFNIGSYFEARKANDKDSENALFICASGGKDELTTKTSPNQKANKSPNQKANRSPNQKANTYPNQKVNTYPNQKAKTYPNQKANTSPNQKANTSPKPNSQQISKPKDQHISKNK